MSDLIHELGFYSVKKKWPKGLEEMPDILKRAAAALSEADQHVKDARREALEEAANYHDDLADQHAASSKEERHHVARDQHAAFCVQHQRHAVAIRALIPSEPHDAEVRDTPRRGDPSIFDDAEGRN